jgi:hypothetical protein
MESLIVRHGSRGTRSTLDGLEKSDTGGGPVYHKVKDRLHLLPHRDTAPVFSGRVHTADDYHGDLSPHRVLKRGLVHTSLIDFTLRTCLVAL